MRDKYNLNTLPASLAALDECEYGEWISNPHPHCDFFLFVKSLNR